MLCDADFMAVNVFCALAGECYCPDNRGLIVIVYCNGVMGLCYAPVEGAVLDVGINNADNGGPDLGFT
jgi:hypothetical protein